MPDGRGIVEVLPGGRIKLFLAFGTEGFGTVSNGDFLVLGGLKSNGATIGVGRFTTLSGLESIAGVLVIAGPPLSLDKK